MNFLLKKFSTILLTTSFLLLIYTFYKSEIFWDGINRNDYKIYYLISLILICLSIITFFINDKIKQYLIILVISLLTSLYLFEGYLILKEEPSKRQLYERRTDTKWDTRSKYEIYIDLKKQNNKVTLLVPTNFFFSKKNLIFPFSNVSDSKTIHCNENGYYSIYQSDRYGFNNPDNQWDKKEIEYLLVGDSFVNGACVNRPNDISSVLRNLSNKSVLNLGINGKGPLSEYATLREYLNTNVKKVLWIYYEGNDLQDLKTEKTNNFLINYLKDLNFTQNLKLKQNKIDELIINLIKKEVAKKDRRDEVAKKDRTDEVERKDRRDAEGEREEYTFTFKLIKFIKISSIRHLITMLAIKPSSSLKEFKTILQLTKELTNKNNSKLYFVYLPRNVSQRTDYDKKHYNLLKNLIRKLKIEFIDIDKEVFDKEQNLSILYALEGGHYSVEGYKRVAEIIYKFTKD